MIDEFMYIWIHLIDEFMYNRGLTFHTSNNHTVRIDFPGKFLPQHDGHWQILEHVMWCLFLRWFFLLKIPYHPIFIWLCHTMKEFLPIKILIAHIQTFPNNIISNYQFGTYLMNIVVVHWLLSQKHEFDVYFLWQD